MAFFRRAKTSSEDRGQAIAAFWEWWQVEGAASTAHAVADGAPGRIARVLSDKVAAIDGDLAWELAAGTRAQHVLVVTAEGAAELRAPARRWLRKAPPSDATWEYADLRQPVADVTTVILGVGDDQLALADVLVAARRTGHRLDVTVHHPRFGELAEAARHQVAFLALDSALGEADTEVWVGEVATSEVAPLDAFGLHVLRSAVLDLKADSLDQDGHPTWALLRGEDSRGPVLAVAQVPLSPLFSPDLDQHVAVRVPFADRTPEGFPGPGSLEELRRLEDHLTERLGGSGRLVAHQSQQGVRLLHAYVDSMTPAAEQIRAAVTGWSQGQVRVDATLDPSWSAVSHLRT
jgi:hypothetical protein